jgi:hypothetical protein
MTAFLFGFAPSVEDSAFLPSAAAYQQVGNNTGNIAFCYAINQQLGGNLKTALWLTPAATVDKLGSIGVLTLANQLGPHADYGWLTKNFEQLECKLVGIGLGAQAGNSSETVDIPQGTLDWIRTIQDRSASSAPNIAMRGEFSRQALDRYKLADKTVALGCPTLFISPDIQLGQTIAARFTGSPKHVAIAAGHQHWAHLSRIEASLVQIANATGGAYICQSPLEMVRLGRGESRLLSQQDRDACRVYACPGVSDEQFSDWCDRHALSFFSASAWLEYLRRFDFVIGTRIHGVMLALQVGIPGLCIAHDSRTRELCETMKVPYVMASQVSAGIKREDIPKLFNFDPEDFDANRQKLAAKYVKFLRDNGLNPANYLELIAQASSDTLKSKES